MPGVPSRVVQYEAPDAIDDSAAIWQINDADHSFCTRPFRIKYARQDVFLAVMISFNLSLRAVERLLLNSVIIRLELLYAPVDMVMSASSDSIEFSLCANHDFRIPPKALLGLHAYCPVHFDTWHMVLVDVTVHSVLLKANSSSFLARNMESDVGQVGMGSMQLEAETSQVASEVEIDAKDIALWKALIASRDILKHELHSLSSAIQQHIALDVLENTTVISMTQKLNLTSLDDHMSHSQKSNGERKIQLRDQNWSQDVADSLKLNDKSRSGSQHAISSLITKMELLTAFQALGSELSVLWNGFLKFHRSNRSLLLEYLRGVWADERSTEWSMWLIRSKMDNDIGYESSRNLQLPNKSLLKKSYEEASLGSASRAELHRKSLEQMKMNSRALQDMQIFGDPSQMPILYLESQIVPCEKVVSDVTLSNNHNGLESSVMEKSDTLLAMTSKSRGKVLRVIVFVHGFQGHHLDLRLVRNHWLSIDPSAECLMSEINEDRTTSDFRELGHRLAEEVATYMKTKFGAFLKKASFGNCRLSFVGHSMGNIIIRAALTDAAMKPLLQYLYTFLSISGPHLGYMYSSNTIFNSGLWLLKKLKASPCMHQLTFTDEAHLQDCFLFKLSQEKTFEYFQNVLVLSSPQDRYVPYHSARIEMCLAATRDSRKGPAYATMHQSCLDQILKPSIVNRNFLRCDVNFDTSAQARTLNNLIGRTAHIEFLETDVFLRFLMWTLPQFFS